MKDSMLLILGVAMVATAALGAVPTSAVPVAGDPVGRLESLWAGSSSGLVASVHDSAQAVLFEAPAANLNRPKLGESALLLLLGGALLGTTWVLRRRDS